MTSKSKEVQALKLWIFFYLFKSISNLNICKPSRTRPRNWATVDWTGELKVVASKLQTLARCESNGYLFLWTHSEKSKIFFCYRGTTRHPTSGTIILKVRSSLQIGNYNLIEFVKFKWNNNNHKKVFAFKNRLIYVSIRKKK